MQETLYRNFSYTDFHLSGFSGPREWKQLLVLPFSLMFIFSTTANSILIYIICSQRKLHTPMYLLIAALAIVDLFMPVFFVPHLLLNLLFGWNGISLVGCLVQMFCIHYFRCLQPTLLVWMSIDRYYAICVPLRYNEFMSSSNFFKYIIVLLLRNTILILAFVCLAGLRSYCQTNLINHCFCEHMALVTLACDSIDINNIVGMTTLLGVYTADEVCVAGSYVIIFLSVLKSGKSRQKAIGTCITNVVVMIVGLFFALTALLSYRIKNDIPPNIRMLFSTMYILFPSCFNPIIYGIRSTEIRHHLLKLVKGTKIFAGL